MKLLHQTDSSKLLLKLFLILAAIFASPFKAVAEVKGPVIEFALLLFSVVLLLPLIALFIILLLKKNVEKALYLISVIWGCSFILIGIVFRNPFNESWFWEDWYWLWLPITLLEILAILRFQAYRKRN